MLMMKCPQCGGEVRPHIDNMVICTRCLLVFEDPQSRKCSTAERKTREQVKSIGIIVTVIAFFASFFTCNYMFIMIMMGVSAAILSVYKEKDKAKPMQYEFKPRTNVLPGMNAAPPAPRRNLSEPVSCQDYMSAFFQLNLPGMPLGKYGAEAVRQIQQLAQKQQALRQMLRPGHPFLSSGNDAEAYILNNCNHMLKRLRFCDQTTEAFLGEHEYYLRRLLRDNEKVLNDFERFLIEVTQMDDNAPQQEPYMDVLAEAMYNVRTYDGAMDQEKTNPFPSFQTMRQ